MWLRTVASVTPSWLEMTFAGAPAPIRSNTSSWRRVRGGGSRSPWSSGAGRLRCGRRLMQQVDQQRPVGVSHHDGRERHPPPVPAGADVGVEAAYRPAAECQARVRAAGVAGDRSVGPGAAEELPARAADGVRLGHSGETFDGPVPCPHAEVIVNGEHGSPERQAGR